MRVSTSSPCWNFSRGEVFKFTPMNYMHISLPLKKTISSAILLPIGFSVGLLLFRIAYSGSIYYLFLLWNLFLASITAVDGFVDENQAPIGLDDGVADIIWEYSPDVLVNAIKDKMQSFTAVEEKKSEALEPDLVPTQIGA